MLARTEFHKLSGMKAKCTVNQFSTLENQATFTCEETGRCGVIVPAEEAGDSLLMEVGVDVSIADRCGVIVPEEARDSLLTVGVEVSTAAVPCSR